MGDPIRTLSAPLTVDALRRSPNALAPFYRQFRVSERTLLTGHSHQAWPDRAFEGLELAWRDAALQVDDKWARAFEQADRVRTGFAHLLDDDSGYYSLAAATHDLMIKLLSALPLERRPKIVTTDGEFHAFARQLLRLEEEGIEVVRVASHPSDTVGERLAAAVCDRTALAYTSTVFFRTAEIAGDLTPVANACRREGIPLVLDAYHHLNIVPISLRQLGLEDAFVVGGGYKYCQLGEGNCFLRFPTDCKLRPVMTGWFAEFGDLSQERTGKVRYNAQHDRFAGSTYDPVSHYRGAAVFSFFQDMDLEVDLLRKISQHQIGLLSQGFDNLDLAPAVIERSRDVPLERLGGFLALRSPHAGEFHQKLKAHRVLTDFRGDVLRLGPAPYLSDAQLEQAIQAIGDAAKTIAQ